MLTTMLNRTSNIAVLNCQESLSGFLDGRKVGEVVAEKDKLTFRIWTASNLVGYDGDRGFGLEARCDGDFGVFGAEEPGEGCADV